MFCCSVAQRRGHLLGLAALDGLADVAHGVGAGLDLLDEGVQLVLGVVGSSSAAILSAVSSQALGELVHLGPVRRARAARDVREQ